MQLISGMLFDSLTTVVSWRSWSEIQNDCFRQNRSLVNGNKSTNSQRLALEKIDNDTTMYRPLIPSFVKSSSNNQVIRARSEQEYEVQHSIPEPLMRRPYPDDNLSNYLRTNATFKQTNKISWELGQTGAYETLTISHLVGGNSVCTLWSSRTILIHITAPCTTMVVMYWL